MTPLLADESFEFRAVVGARRRMPELDIVAVHEIGLRGVDDPTILAWAASEGRVLLTPDLSTMSGYAKARLAAGERMPGVFLAPPTAPVRQLIEDILLIAVCSHEGEWEGQILFLPIE
jgi:hypothetical protein